MAAPLPTFTRLAILIALGLGSASAGAESLFADGKPLLDLRLRYETVDDEAFARDADALTLRTRLGWRSGSVNGLYFLVEAEDVRALIDDYNSTANGRTQYPTVADPEDNEINQAYLGWDYRPGGQLILGRQRLLLDNQRFIGNVGWRQNEQTFDALSLAHAFDDRWTLRYSWLDSAQRVFGNSHPNPLQASHDLDAHLVNLAYRADLGMLSAYSYLIENEDIPAASTDNLGLRFTGAHKRDERFECFYSAEYAQQSGWRDAPDTGSVSYLLLETGLRIDGHGIRIGTEQLGSNGRRAFQTPLATGHAFNGWADRFLVTPAAGLDDRYVKIDGPLGPLRYQVAWHDFQAERGSADYGRELDALLSWAFAPKFSAMVKFADYRSDGFGSDQQKVVLALEYKY